MKGGAWQEREEELEAQLNRGALWAITYGDLMSYLMLFFMILFIASASKSVSIQMGLMAVEQKFGGKSRTLIGQLTGEHGVQQIAKLEIRESKLKMIFNEPILFDPGSAELKPDAIAPLDTLAEALRDIPNTVQIEGHTDDRPLLPGSRFASNWELSAARAFSVLRFLEGAEIPARRLSAIGYGEHRPLRANDTPENRAVNRRIEVNITRMDD